MARPAGSMCGLSNPAARPAAPPVDSFRHFRKTRSGMINRLPPPVSLALLVLVSLNHVLAATGPVRIAKDFPHSFQYQTGERFFPMGDTAYFLIAQPTNVIARFIDSRRAHQFNFIRMMPMAPGHWAFGGTPGKPDYTVINQTAMAKLDWVF